MKKRKYRIFVGDFETTVYDWQDSTEVWASGLCELGKEKAIILHSIKSTFDYLCQMKESVVVYYHNLKFDGAFWLDFLLNQHKFIPAFYDHGNNRFEAMEERKMPYHSPLNSNVIPPPSFLIYVHAKIVPVIIHTIPNTSRINTRFSESCYYYTCKNAQSF